MTRHGEVLPEPIRTELFRRTLAVFAGERYPLAYPAGKVLLGMVRGGSDARITVDGFHHRCASYRGGHEVIFSTAPAVVSELFRLAGAAPAPRVRAVIGPGTMPPHHVFSFERALLWMDAEPAAVTISVRPAAGESFAAGPSPLPEPVPRPVRYLDLATPMPCPHCARPAERWRHLYDGSLVCPACHRSFDPGS